MKCNSTIIIARILSLYLLVTGVGFLVSGRFYSEMISQSESDPVLINLSGMVHFFIGAVIISFNFKWKNAIEIMISLLGLMFLVKGSLLIAIPEVTLKTGGNPAQEPNFMSVFFISFGLALGYLSFIKKKINA